MKCAFILLASMLIKIVNLQLDSAARARKLLLEDRSHVSAGSSNDLLLGAGLTNLEYGYLCEIMGRSVWAPQIFNCGAPDTGNMEVRQIIILIHRNDSQRLSLYLTPLAKRILRNCLFENSYLYKICKLSMNDTILLFVLGHVPSLACQ